MNIALPYLAGLIDGEGHFVVNVIRAKFYNPMLQIRLSYDAGNLLDLIKASYGGSICDQPRHRTWTIIGKEALSLAGKLRPFVFIKRRQCALFCELEAVRDMLETNARGKVWTDAARIDALKIRRAVSAENLNKGPPKSQAIKGDRL